MRALWLTLVVSLATCHPHPAAPKPTTCGDGTCSADETFESCPIDCQPKSAVVTPPRLAALDDSTPPKLHAYTFALQGNVWRASDDAAAAELVREGDVWKLALHANRALSQVMFPWDDSSAAVGDRARVYYPYLGGVVEADGARQAFAWWGLPYPGESFAPLIVVANDTHARLVASATWPIRPVVPMHAARASMLSWPERVEPGERRSLSVMISDFVAAPGYAPWQLAILRYKRWLATVAPAETDPAWLVRNEGFLNVQLQNAQTFDVAAVERAWKLAAPLFDWVIFWGQASTYAGAAAQATPSPGPDEEVGCCTLRHDLHPRYRALPVLARGIVSAGGHVAYYTRSVAIETDAESKKLREWIAHNRTLGADAMYIDTLGRTKTARPAQLLARFADGTVPAASLIEGFVDVYPRPSLISGYVAGGGSWPGGPTQDPATCGHCTFVRLGRLLLGSRPVYFGASNGEFANFGKDAPQPHFSERTAFLLGAKLDVISVEEKDGTANAYVAEIVRLRRANHWWTRAPEYLDTLGLTEIPAEIEIRRFHANDGVDLLAIDNPRELAGRYVTLRNHRVPIAVAKLSIAEVR